MDSFKHEVRDNVIAIYEIVREEIKNVFQFIREAWLLILLLLALITIVIWLAKPAPPTHVLIGTGAIGDSYEDLGMKYVEFFKKNGVTLELEKTKGAEENLQLIKDNLTKRVTEQQLQRRLITIETTKSQCPEKPCINLRERRLNPLP
jgi:hypothetical protein